MGRPWRAGEERHPHSAVGWPCPSSGDSVTPGTASSVTGRDLGTPSSSQSRLCRWGRVIHPKLAGSQPAAPCAQILQPPRAGRSCRTLTRGQADPVPRGNERHENAAHQQTLLPLLQSHTPFLPAPPGSQNLGTAGWFRLEGTFQLVQLHPLP